MITCVRLMKSSLKRQPLSNPTHCEYCGIVVYVAAILCLHKETAASVLYIIRWRHRLISYLLHHHFSGREDNFKKLGSRTGSLRSLKKIWSEYIETTLAAIAAIAATAITSRFFQQSADSPTRLLKLLRRHSFGSSRDLSSPRRDWKRLRGEIAWRAKRMTAWEATTRQDARLIEWLRSQPLLWECLS